MADGVDGKKVLQAVWKIVYNDADTKQLTHSLTHVTCIEIVYAEATLLADNMKIDINTCYIGCARREHACHRYHSRSEDDMYAARSGTIIQKDIWTFPRLSSQSHSFLRVYKALLAKDCK
jgi:hypothetical protein